MAAEGQSPVSKKTTKPKSRSSAEHLMKRVSRACLHCRQRKSRCDLDISPNPGTPPCQRCLRDKRECVLGSSNRGGRRIRKNKISNITPAAVPTPTMTVQLEETSSSPNSDRSHFPVYSGSFVYVQSEHAVANGTTAKDDEIASNADSAIEEVPRNPSDAWQCLSRVANRGAETTDAERLEDRQSGDSSDLPSTNGTQNGQRVDYHARSRINEYTLVQNRSLDPETVWFLVSRYAEHFHPYFPLVPRRYFDRNALGTFATKEKHLLTAVLTIATKDLVERPDIHEHCSQYMHELISGIAAGADCGVEAVEALLLLAEWEPHGLRPGKTPVGRGEEDRAAWMHVGLALRTGYFLGLDRTSFRGDCAGDPQTDERKRLAWANCYISDRLISVRIGRAFWSRGPGPMTGLVSQDFPSLQPMSDGDEDYANIFQASLDLTQLYGNVHDVLYSGMRTSNQMMLMGDYVKYADDFRSGILRWNQKWGNLACSHHIKATLRMSYEYLRLYTNAFAFQAAISQTLVSKPKDDAHPVREHLRTTFSNLSSMQDARFIYDSVDAAKAYLNLLVRDVDPERHLRYMPLRFYFYGIYAAVFLYKARSFGVLRPKEELVVRELVSRTTEKLNRASPGPDDIGSRYARLLELLWKPKSTITALPSPQETHLSNDVPVPAPIPSVPEACYMQFSPANDFSWLDLEAVGDYVDPEQMTGTDILGFDSFQSPTVYTAGQERSLWQAPAWANDMSANLPF
ncbi:transcriptional regulator family: Fungal Specific TF [Paecilomyces variotii]|nr:transcriptional regulator family: Fungal Specific TF [Paecilomyces variotii]